MHLFFNIKTLITEIRVDFVPETNFKELKIYTSAVIRTFWPILLPRRSNIG